MSTQEMPALHAEYLERIDPVRLEPQHRVDHPPRILLLYGSLRPRSFSRLLVLEAERILQAMGAETRVFDPAGLPVADSVPPAHPKVQELRELSIWSEGQAWCSPERHGNIELPRVYRRVFGSIVRLLFYHRSGLYRRSPLLRSA
jgi:arsenic resistance protein ArsH